MPEIQRHESASPAAEHDDAPSLAEVRGEMPANLDSKLWDIFSATALAYPHREAIISMWQSSWAEKKSSCSHPSCDQECLRWTYRDLMSKSNRMAASLMELGCRRGMCLGVILWNSAEWGLFFWVAARLAMTFVPIDPRFLQEAHEILRRLRPEVVVTQDADMTGVVDKVEEWKSEASIHIQCSEADVEGWMRLSDFWSLGDDARSPLLNRSEQTDPIERRDANEDAAEDAAEDTTEDAADEDAALLIFTSGTTGSPKGCLHTNRNLLSQTCDYDPNLDTAFVDRWLVHTPVSHIFAVNNALRSWRYGGAVVFPSRSFKVEATAQALAQEKCTVMSATPTLVKALLAHASLPKPGELDLSVVSIAATRITLDDIRLCREELGARSAIQAYGMSEGAPLISWLRTDKMNQLGAGKVLPGVAVRVCHPRSRRVLGRMDVGELHVSGPSVISKYWCGIDADAFYCDSSGRWLVTGDQAMVDRNGVVHILGRYKDLVIRGGENLNPARIEEALQEISGVQAWVVGAPDSLAGEVPVAVVQIPNGVSKAQLYARASELGSKYSLGGVYTLEELHLECLPTTSLGKVKRETLKEAVREIRAQHSEQVSVDTGSISRLGENTSNDLMALFIDIWEDLVGHRPAPDTGMAHFADSITLLRYCDAVFRFSGKRLYLQDVVEHDTAEKQAQLLEAREQRECGQFRRPASIPVPRGREPYPETWSSKFSNVPKTMHMGQQRQMKCRSQGHGRILLEEAREEADNLGLSGSLIEDIIPVRESLHRMVLGQRPQSYHVRMVFRVHHASSQRIRHGLEKGLMGRSMLRAVRFQPSRGGLYHIILGPSHQLFRNLISVQEVRTEDEAKRCWQDGSSKAQSFPFMFEAEIIAARESGNRYLLMLFNHSIIDALSLWPWHKDLDLLIDDLNSHVWTPTPFRLFADLFNQYRNSSPAREAVAFHVKQLRGISRLTDALWPVQKAPGWMISDDQSSRFATWRHRVREEIWNGEWKSKASTFRFPRLGRIVCLPKLRKLKDRGIEPSLFAKSAIAVFNILQTGASHALFNTWESGRSWPFIPQWIEKVMPPAMSIDGPTVEWLPTMIEVPNGETISDFLERMNAENEELKLHEHVPWQKVVKELRDEGDVAVDASFRQSFVWDVSLGLSMLKELKELRNGFKCLEPVARLDWADCGLCWNAFMIDRDNLYFVVSWDTAQMNDVQVEACCDCLADVMRKLADEDNWERTIGDVFNR